MIGIKYAAQHMIEHGGGCIVNIASVMGLISHPGLGCYSAAKHGVVGLTKAAALELGPLGVRVKAVCPGRYDTPMGGSGDCAPFDDEGQRSEKARLHLASQRNGQPSEIGETVAFLCSAAARNIHGIALPVDGGWTAH